MGTVLAILGIGLVALVGVEYGLRLRAKRRMEEGTFDHGLPFIAHGDHHGEDRIGDQGALDHVDPSDHPGV